MKRKNETSGPSAIASIVFTAISMVAVAVLLSSCQKDTPEPSSPAVTTPEFTIEQAISDEAQRNTIAFDGLAFLTGCLGSQSFLPPGKVADYSGFQYLRDNDPTKLGHNTSFVTIIAFNILHILTSDQIALYVNRAQTQIDSINQFAYNRYPLLKAFRRLKDGDLPNGMTELSKEEVMNFTASLYILDGQISYDRAMLFSQVIASMTPEQRSQMDALKALNGIGHWNNTLSDPLMGMGLSQDVNVAVMTYASEMYAWYAGSVTTDTYFCPERHGTYFGSFYLKDWPAMGNPNYTIDETLTAEAGQKFLALLNSAQADLVRGIVDQQRNALSELVTMREAISTELRKLLVSQTADSATVMTLSARYGELDGELSYYYATTFTQVYNTLTQEQKTKILQLANDLGYLDPPGGFLYSAPIQMPAIENTDHFFK